MAEAGHPGIECDSWGGIVVPAGTPKEIITLLNREIVGSTPEAFAEAGGSRKMGQGDPLGQRTGSMNGDPPLLPVTRGSIVFARRWIAGSSLVKPGNDAG